MPGLLFARFFRIIPERKINKKIEKQFFNRENNNDVKDYAEIRSHLVQNGRINHERLNELFVWKYPSRISAN